MNDVHPAGLDHQFVGCTPPEPLLGYQEGWRLQQEIHAEVAAHLRPDKVLFVQHESTYTIGRRTEARELPRDGTPVVEVNRGGKITWHGPGQLTGYPIIWLPEGVGVVDYVRRLEEALVRYLVGELGIACGRVPDRTGVWLPATQIKPERKICAIGVRVAQRTTLHGFGLNVSPALDEFENIIPCGIEDAPVTSIAAELGAAPSLVEVGEGLLPYLAELFSFESYIASPELAQLSNQQAG